MSVGPSLVNIFKVIFVVIVQSLLYPTHKGFHLMKREKNDNLIEMDTKMGGKIRLQFSHIKPPSSFCTTPTSLVYTKQSTHKLFGFHLPNVI